MSSELDGSDDVTEAVKRPRRTQKIRGTGAGYNDALERLRQAKQSGTKNKYVVIDEKPVYDYVSEDKYSKMVESRQNDDWVVDDGIADGYADDGREIFEDDEMDDYEDRQRRPKKEKNTETAGAKKNPNIMKPEDVQSGNIKTMFEKSVSTMKNRKKEFKEHVDMDNADDILGDILGELRQQPSGHTASPFSSKPTTSGMSTSSRAPPLPTFSTMPTEPKTRNVFAAKPLAPIASSKPTPVTAETFSINGPEPPLMDIDNPVVAASVTEDSCEFDAALLSSVAAECEDIASSSTQSSATAATPSSTLPESTKPSLPSFTTSDNAFVDSFADQQQPGAGYADLNVDASNLPLTTNSNNEKIMRIYWYDAYEDAMARTSHIYLFGKVFVESLSRYASVCLVVKNVERRIYVLPREGCTFLDCREEISQLLASKKIMRERYNKRELGHVSTFDDPNIPASAQYLEVRYPAEFPALPSDLSGRTFSRIFGTSSSGIEVFFVEKKMKGPCWIDVKNPLPPPSSAAKVSWCKFEIHVPETRNISVFVPPSDAKINATRSPDFTVLSLSFRFLSKSVGKSASSGQNAHSEIVSVTGLVHSAFRFDRPAPHPPFQEQFTIITQPSDVRMPLDFKDSVKTRLPGIKVDTVPNERALLSLFVQKMAKYDPDIIVAHDFSGYQLDTLLNRFATDKVPAWSRIGALIRPVVPRVGMPARQHVTSGRLICDILHIAKELVRQRSYDLTELAFSILNKRRVVFEPEHVALAYGNSASLIDLLKSGLDDADTVLKIAYELNALPLANQLSQICGCLLSRVMAGGRSERNEWLLLHAFADRNFIPPEKSNPFAAGGKGRRPVAQAEEDSDEEENVQVKAGKGASKRKPAYSGGLVLEPKKGFYDKFILLLDFNSLYPSIIQEFNICFTTVAKQANMKSETIKSEPVVKPEPVVKDEPDVKGEPVDGANVTDEIDEVASLILPSSSVAPGVLPSVLKTLVQSRHEVKKLMQAPNVPTDLLTQYDIRQRALKLTANSMYGCLGFTHSRFYARPLASLITSKGREILSATRDLVTNMGLDVIYGDTDSVMINSNCTNFEDVMKLGQRIKNEVNKHYRLLEIEVDGVFKTMLLLKKKKYAALAISRTSDGQFKTKEELRGLDIVRRDWCPLSRHVGGFVVTQILQSDSMERVVETISNKLSEVAQQVSSGEVEMAEFAIARQMARDPDSYADAKSLPHVLVAQRLNKLAGGGRKFRAGDAMFYVICDDGTGSSVSHVQRAYHPDEVTKPDSKLKIDTKYYLAQQIHPVVSRLCEPIPGLDAARIAELLGLDPSAYRRALGNANGSGSGSGDIADGLLAQFTLSMMASSESRFANCDKFHFPCPMCNIEINVDRTFVGEGADAYFTLEKCPHCKKNFEDQFHEDQTIIDALKQQIVQHITRYYAGWYTCEEPACAYRTSRLSARLYQGQPLCPACEKAPLIAEYSERQLYEQLLCYKMMFDVERAKKTGLPKEPMANVRKVYDDSLKTVDDFLKNSSYARVLLGNIFSVCLPAARHRKQAPAISVY